MESNPEKFCPISNTTCRHDECMMHRQDDCLIASTCESLKDAAETIDMAIDVEQFRDAVHFFATLDNAPIYETVNGGSVPWIHVLAQVANPGLAHA